MEKRLLFVLPTICLLAALVLGVCLSLTQSKAASCSPWYRCPITQYYGQNSEHGVDIYTHYLPVTALLSGTITFVHIECWEYPCPMVITWKLDRPWLARGSPYAYVQIRTSRVWVGEHVNVGTTLGYSGVFIEFGLTPDRAYGVSNWRWGVNPLTVWPWL